MAELTTRSRVKRASAAVECADLVAGGIAQVGEIELARCALAPPRRVFDAPAAMGDAGVVEGLDLLNAVAGKADGTAVVVCRDLAVDRVGDGEGTSFGAIDDAALWIGYTLRNTDGTKRGVVELLGRGDIVGSNEDMAEHRIHSFCRAWPWTTKQASFIE